MSVLLLGKEDDFYCARAVEFLRIGFPGVQVILGRRCQPLPETVREWRGDHLISYLSPWIVPEWLLARAGQTAVNFHPGAPEYPGIGCTNFALYNGETIFGVTCHHMAAAVNTGPIIAVRRFRLLPADTVWSLTQRCYGYILALFYDIATLLIQGKPLPRSDESWKRAPYRRAELDALCRTDPRMPDDEVRRRLRAVTFPGMPGAVVEVSGFRFRYEGK